MQIEHSRDLFNLLNHYEYEAARQSDAKLAFLEFAKSHTDVYQRAHPPGHFTASAWLVNKDGTRVLCSPGDPRHSVTQRALPGVTRLLYRNKRFEPVDGFEALFG